MKIDPGALAFDIDGVIADTMHLFMEILREDEGIRIHYDDITCYQLETCLDVDLSILEAVIDKILSGRYQQTLSPIPGAKAVLERIIAVTGRVLMVTARPDDALIRDWMKGFLGNNAAKADIVATGAFEAKADVLHKNQIRWFVEDRIETCRLLKAEGIEPVVFRQPWNRVPHDFIEVGSWSDLERWIAFPAHT